MKGFAGICGLEKITKDEYEEIMNDYDPIEAPPGPYKVQPDRKGTMLNPIQHWGGGQKRHRAFYRLNCS